MFETMTYVVRRHHRRAPAMARVGDRVVRKFPAILDLTYDQAEDLKGRGFRLVASPPPVAVDADVEDAPEEMPAEPPDPEVPLADMTKSELFAEFDARGVEPPPKDTRKADLVAILEQE